MIRHVALFIWREEVSDADVASVCDTLRGLPAAIPEIERYEFGPDLGLVAGNADFAVLTTLADGAALRRYLDHPAHVPIASRMRAMAASRTAVQIEAAP